MGEKGEHLGGLTIGIIADTHGLVRPEAVRAFASVDHIVHAGDVGGNEVLDALRAIAPVTFVGGNNDAGTEGLDIVRVRIDGWRILLTHILPKPQSPARRVLTSLAEEPADLVIFGHSHLPHDEVIDGVRFFNPASAGPRRFDYPVAVGIVRNGDVAHIPLDERSVMALKTRMNQLSHH